MSKLLENEVTGLEIFNPSNLKGVNLADLEVSQVSDNSAYWSPVEKGETKLVFFDSMTVETISDLESGEEKLLPTVHLWEQSDKGELSRVSNSSARLVGLFERMNYRQGTPLKITFAGKEKNKNNSYQSDSWDVRQLYPKNS